MKTRKEFREAARRVFERLADHGVLENHELVAASIIEQALIEEHQDALARAEEHLRGRARDSHHRNPLEAAAEALAGLRP